ncbi:MAG: DUF4956 domain-containing protein [Pseudonocardia sp.]
MKYLDLLIDLGINFFCLFVLAVVLYYRRHRRGDLLLAYVSLNVGLFITMSLLTSVRVDIAAGFGLFALLSIIQLRSTTVTQEEVAYYFAVLVLGMVNGLRLHDRLTTLLLDAALIGSMYVVDSRRIFARSLRVEITLDTVHEDASVLVADLERRLRGTVLHYIVDDIDYVREIMVVDVRYRRRDPATPEPEVLDPAPVIDESPEPTAAR